MSFKPIDAKSVFLQALEFTSTAERVTFVDRACAGNSQLRARVMLLLQNVEVPDSLLDQTGSQPDPTHVVAEGMPAVSLEFLKPCETPGSLGRLGSYTILEVIGRGGMGIVLRAMDSKLNRVVAIKVLATEYAGNPQARKRFLREAQAAAAVSHDHVVTIHAVDDDENVPFIVMECIVGQSLQQKIDATGALRLKEILRIGMQIAAGLAAAHQQGLVHRDIKPANILLENGIERVKITDFGLARATDDVGMTQSGQIAGTPQYMSPEQAMGQPVDPRSDLFSLGSVLYTLCTGRPAFRADSTIAVLRRVCDDTPRPIAEINPEVPDWLIAMINRLLSKQSQDRYQTAQEVFELFSQSLAHLAQPNLVPLPGSMNVTPSSSPGRKSASPRETNAGRSHWTLVGVGFFCAVIVVGIAVVQWLRPQARATSDETRVNGAARLTSEEQGEKRLVTEAAAPLPTRAPFDAVQARNHQEAWAKHLGVPVEWTNNIGMRFRLIPPGQFQMGSSAAELAALKEELQKAGTAEFDLFVSQSSGPRHRVALSQPFYIGQYEVTVTQYRQFLEETGYQSSASRAGAERFRWQQFVTEGDQQKQPICGVSWEDAESYCQWLNTRASKEPSRGLYSLPTEAQWEYACRAGTETLWVSGDDVEALSEFAIFGQTNTFGPAQVGLRRENSFGLFDMHGNVEEWCLDWHNHGYYARSPLTDPLFNDPPSEKGSGKVARGGAWNCKPWSLRSTTRNYDFPDKPTHARGFRVVCQVAQARR